MLAIICCLAPSLGRAEPDTAAAGTTRTLHFLNQCDAPVWFGLAGGAVDSRRGGPCSTDADCPPGSACQQTGDVRQCFWNNPRPVDGSYRLAPKGGSSSTRITAASDDMPIVWSGVVTARLGCTDAGCAVADCGNDGRGGCAPSRGFEQPATQAEFTLQSRAADFYDVEVINGVSVPVSMAPVLPARAWQTLSDDAPYFCGTPGAPTPTSKRLGGCAWKFEPPSIEYRWVTPGGGACWRDADCRSGGVCGLSFNAGDAAGAFKKTCGTLLGLWSANQVCGVQADYGAPFNCQRSAGRSSGVPVTLRDLYHCTNVGSCYQPGATSECCGCANWDQAGLTVPPGPYTEQCINSNPQWRREVQPRLEWLKRGCPTAYVYPYDDMSSTFTCENATGGVNKVNYLITFCPQGVQTPPKPTPPPPPQDFTQTVTSTGASSVEVKFVGAQRAHFVILHYSVNDGGQVNTQMRANHDGTVYTQAVDGLQPGDRLTYSFTYWIGAGATDSSTMTYTFGRSSDAPTYSYTVYVAGRSPPVLINGSVRCEQGCPIKAQAGTAITVASTVDPSRRCALPVQRDGTVSISTDVSSICSRIYASPASSATAGVIALPGGF
ncbi:MAG TPA: thaumatin family protein [Myxococcota bacterium]|nr:thaumatin family protein [Myxococcota bacterium]